MQVEVRALLAALSPEERLRLFSGHTFEQMTEKSIASIEQLETEMKKTNAQGYALADEERFKDIRSVGVAIFNHRDEPIAALSAVAPKVRLKLTDIPAFARKVVEAGNEISRKMGRLQIQLMRTIIP